MAHLWSKKSTARQLKFLRESRDIKDIRSTINRLLSKHSKKAAKSRLKLSELVCLVDGKLSALDDVEVYVIEVQGKQYISRELFESLETGLNQT